MIPAALLAMLTVAFPSQGKKLPPVDHAYVIGAVAKGETNIFVNGASVGVYRTGAFATVIDVTAGENRLEVVTAGGERTNLVFSVERKPAPSASSSESNAPARVYEKLEYAGDEPKEPPTNRAPSAITVVLDAGHGGTDTGALSPHGFFEKDANLQLTRQIRIELERRGYRVLMTREDDTACALYDRPKLAHEADADLFVSIHHNAPPVDKDPNDLRYFAVFAWNEIGERIARSIHARVAAALDGKLKMNGVIHANYAVTRNPEIPSCLIEADFITSPEGEEASWNGRRRVLMARAIADGVDDWCGNAGRTDHEPSH